MLPLQNNFYHRYFHHPLVNLTIWTLPLTHLTVAGQKISHWSSISNLYIMFYSNLTIYSAWNFEELENIIKAVLPEWSCGRTNTVPLCPLFIGSLSSKPFCWHLNVTSFLKDPLTSTPSAASALGVACFSLPPKLDSERWSWRCSVLHYVWFWGHKSAVWIWQMWAFILIEEATLSDSNILRGLIDPSNGLPTFKIKSLPNTILFNDWNNSSLSS